MSDDSEGPSSGASGPPDPDEDAVERELDEAAFGAAYGVRRVSDRNPEATLQGLGTGATAFENIDRAELRDQYGYLRAFFKQHADQYHSFQRQLTQAWIGETHDRYLAATVRRMGVIFAAVVALTVALAAGLVGLTRGGVLPSPSVLSRSGMGTVVALTIGVAISAGTLCAGSYWLWHRVYRVRSIIARRRREINYNLPFAVTFMYALSRAGVNFDQILIRLADSKGTYGGVAEEYDRVVRDMETFGNNLYVGLDNLRAVTPSEELKGLTDDLMTVLETGGDMSAFLRDEVDTQLQTATDEQESFIETLELLSEVFVVGFVAAPLFVLVVLIVISFLGGETLPVITGLVYVAFPLALVGFVLLIDMRSQPFRTPPLEFSTRDRRAIATDDVETPTWGEQYERDKQRRGIRARLEAQFEQSLNTPGHALLFSVPLALAVLGAGVWFGRVPVTVSGLLATPVGGTIRSIVGPLVIVTTPVILLYEYRTRQEAVFKRRLPVLLELLAASNRRGLSLTKGLEILTESADGRVATELQQLQNDIRWNFDVASAFEAFGDRIRAPELARTVKLIAEGSRATSDLHSVLDVAATDTTERLRLRQKRVQTLQTYLAVVIIGFLVYLLVVVMLASNFLAPIEALSAGETATESGPVSLAAIPVRELRLILFHSALIQGFGSGVLAGKLANDSLYSGLKYGVGLVVIAAAAFTFI